jgi:hypothetical protein
MESSKEVFIGDFCLAVCGTVWFRTDGRNQKIARIHMLRTRRSCLAPFIHLVIVGGPSSQRQLAEETEKPNTRKLKPVVEQTRNSETGSRLYKYRISKRMLILQIQYSPDLISSRIDIATNQIYIAKARRAAAGPPA